MWLVLYIDAQTIIKSYCHSLYRRYGTYGEVARRTKIRSPQIVTVKVKYFQTVPNEAKNSLKKLYRN